MIFYTSIAKLKDNSYISNNVDDEQLRIILMRTQLVEVDKLLGKELNNKLLNAISTNTLTAKEIDFIDNYLFFFITTICEIKALTFLKFQMKKKGVGTNSDEFFVTANPENLLNEMNEEKVVFINNILRFLKENKADFPLFKGDASENFNININFV